MGCCGGGGGSSRGYKPQVVRPNLAPQKQPAKVYDFRKNSDIRAQVAKPKPALEKCLVCGHPARLVYSAGRTRKQCTNSACNHIT